MNADYQDFKYKELTEKIIKAFYQVFNTLGYGFLEKVYENSLLIELKKMGLKVVTQSPIKVLYDNQIVGEYFADILVDDKVIVEIKSAKILIDEHEAQLLNYLKATDIEVGLLLNFGPKAEIKRYAFDNLRK
ncbi:MAG: GxxExxY protein [Elusimicrobiota bacterium]